MIRKSILLIDTLLAVLVLLFGVSCTRQELPGGSVTVTLSSGLPETRGAAEVKDGSEVYIDGSGNPDLILLLFDSNGNLKAKYPDNNHSFVVSSTGNDVSIRLAYDTAGALIPAGNYTVYAIANTGGLWSLDSGTVADIDTRDKAEARYFSVPPIVADTPGAQMPLTAKGDVSVNLEGNGSVDLSLRRPVAKVVVRIVNNYGAALTLVPNGVAPMVKLKSIDPDRGYLFQHSPDYAGTSYANKEFAFPGSGEVVLPDNTDLNNPVYELSSLVYPGTGAFSCDIAFKIKKVGSADVDPARAFSYENLPILNNHGEDITALARNQRLTITVTISKGTMLSFSFDVGGWNQTTETVTFD